MKIDPSIIPYSSEPIYIPPSNPKFEYLRIRLHPSEVNIDFELDNLGNDCWELVLKEDNYFYFKRSIL